MRKKIVTSTFYLHFTRKRKKHLSHLGNLLHILVPFVYTHEQYFYPFAEEKKWDSAKAVAQKT